jgi:hypothetical protein
VRDARRYVHEVASPDHGALRQALAVPDLGLAADGVDGGLVPLADRLLTPVARLMPCLPS